MTNSENIEEMIEDRSDRRRKTGRVGSKKLTNNAHHAVEIGVG